MITIEIVNNSKRVTLLFTDYSIMYIPLNEHELKAMGLANDLATNLAYAWKITHRH